MNDFSRYVPYLVIGVVVALRWRRMNRASPLHVGRLWILPLLYALLVGGLLVAMPPAPLWWLALGAGIAAGGLLGWQRASLMRLHIDETSGAIMMRQSPAALVLLVAMMLLRRLAMPAAGAGGPHLAAGALLATDAAIGFAFGMIAMMRLELWRRAKLLLRV